MFWRFGGYANISTIDTILDKPEFTLEELLDESDLIQELKQHNSKLIEYLRGEVVLRKLLEYVVAPKLEVFESRDEDESGRGRESLFGFSRSRTPSQNPDPNEKEDDEEAEKRRNRYALVACEVLSSDTWSIYETLSDNIQLIRDFWDFLGRAAPLDPLQASYFTKVNEALFEKKTDEMMELLMGLPHGVADLLKHVECPMIMDLLLKIIALDRTEGGHGVVEWLHSENLIHTLLSFISPEHSWVVQTAAGDFLKAIITISANASQNEQQCIGPNELTRQLVSKECVEQLISYMLHGGNPLTVGVGIIIEVIRKNNSDYDPDVLLEAQHEPTSRDPIYLGTLLRLFADNIPKFMDLIMDKPTQNDGVESTFGGKLKPLGFDRFKTCELMAELLHCSNMGLLNEEGIEKLIFSRDAERHRLREWGTLCASRDEEASGDDLTMRPSHGAADEGRKLEVTNAGDDGFETVENSGQERENLSTELSQAGAGSEDKGTGEFVDEPLTSPRLDASKDGATEHKFEDPELVVAPLSPSKPAPAQLATATEPVSVPEVNVSEIATTSDEVAAEAEATKPELKVTTTDPDGQQVATGTETVLPIRELSPHPEDTPAPLFSGALPSETPAEASAESKDEEQPAAHANVSIATEPEATSTIDASQVAPSEPLVGDYLKLQFVEHRVVPVILTFFFKYPWNNFLHNVVYDIVQQVFNGPMDRGYNPTLAVSLFEAADITATIIEGQQASDESQAKTRTRMGYMGHLTLIAEEVVKFTERHPPELLSEAVLDKVMSQGWINYVEGALAETRERDNAILGGVRPEVALGHRASLGAGGNLGGIGLGGLTSTNSGANALAEAGLNGGLDAGGDNEGGGGLGSFSIGGSGALISGFGSSSDEDDDDGDVDDEDVNSEFRSYTESMNNQDGSTGPPSLPPPPPPPPLNIPPSRARLQLAARLAMHQKNQQAAQSGQDAAENGSRGNFGDDDDDDGLDPFADVEEDVDDELDHAVANSEAGRGSWWRSVVRNSDNNADGNTADSEDDEEFGDFAMAEDDKDTTTTDATQEKSTLFRPLAVNPAKEAARGLSGLWPFGSKATTQETANTDADRTSEDEVVVSPVEGEGSDIKVAQVKEAAERTSIDEDDEVDVAAEIHAGRG